MNAKQLKIFASVGVLTTLVGCTSPAPRFEAQIGNAVNAAKAQQIINVDAAKNRDPVAGIDGQAAKDAVDRYHDASKAPPPSFTIINVGGSGGGR